MIRNYFLVAWRSMLRNKVFSLITITGLAIALTSCFLLYEYVNFESSYDQFNSHPIYRVPLGYFRGKTDIGGTAGNVPATGPALKAEFPEIQNYARLVKTSLFTSSLTKSVVNSIEFMRPLDGGRLLAFNEENVYMAENSFLQMFSYPLLSGDPTTALKEPNTVVITESMAQKYFGKEPALGKALILNREMTLVVTGVMKDIPSNSHLQFDILISYATLKPTYGTGDDQWNWSVFYTYVELVPGTNPAELDKKLPAFFKKYAPDVADNGEYHGRMYLQPVADIHLRSRLNGEQSTNGNEWTVYSLSLLAVLILIIAGINYVNLSTAKALERSKEVGVRKVSGATRKQLVSQFFMDAFLANLFALTLAVGLTILLWPLFEQLIGKKIPIEFASGPSHWLLPGIVFLMGVVLVGTYPALVLSSFNPAVALKGKYFKSRTGSIARKGMVAFQYFIALILMAGTLLLYRQLSFMQSQDPGYAMDQIVVIEGPAVYDSLTNQKVVGFRNSLLQNPGITNMTASGNVPGQPIIEQTGATRIGDSSKNEDFVGSSVLGVDTSFFSTYQIKLLEGRRFTESETMNFRPRGKEMIRIVVNEEFVKRLGFAEPKLAINEKIAFWWGPNERYAEIIGVCSNHHQLSLKENYDAIIYMVPEWTTWKYFSISVSSPDFQQDLAHIESSFHKAFPDNPFVYFQLNDYYNKQYQTDRKLGEIVGVFTLLAIAITCLGLLGLSIFSVAQRTKEMGIRKVLGASVTVILYLFSRDLLRILIVAYVLAVPLILLGGKNWLDQFPFRAPLGWQIIVAPPALLLFITIAVVGVISIKNALENPVKALRYE